MIDASQFTPRRLKFSTIRSIAEKFRQEHFEDPDEIPINIEDLIERILKIEIRPEFGLLEESKIESFLSNDLKTIVIDSGRYYEKAHEKRTRFTLAHEIGHLVLHANVYESITFSEFNDFRDFRLNLNEDDLDWFEIQADEFAGRLLVPRGKLLDEVLKLKEQIESLIKKLNQENDNNEPELTETHVKTALGRKLSDKFGVNSKVIEIRLKREEIFQEIGISFG